MEVNRAEVGAEGQDVQASKPWWWRGCPCGGRRLLAGRCNPVYILQGGSCGGLQGGKREARGCARPLRGWAEPGLGWISSSRTSEQSCVFLRLVHLALFLRPSDLSTGDRSCGGAGPGKWEAFILLKQSVLSRGFLLPVSWRRMWVGLFLHFCTRQSAPDLQIAFIMGILSIDE